MYFAQQAGHTLLSTCSQMWPCTPATLQGHTDEVLDVAFDSAGFKFISARYVF